MIYSRLSDEIVNNAEKSPGIIKIDLTGNMIRLEYYATVISDILDSHYLEYNIDFNFFACYLMINIKGSFIEGKIKDTFLVDEADGGLMLELIIGNYRNRRAQVLALDKIGFAISHYILGNDCNYCTVDVYPEFR